MNEEVESDEDQHEIQYKSNRNFIRDKTSNEKRKYLKKQWLRVCRINEKDKSLDSGKRKVPRHINEVDK